MKKYYIHDGEKQIGEFTLEDLKHIIVKPTYFVWFEGLDTWMPIEEINELKPYIEKKKQFIQVDESFLGCIFIQVLMILLCIPYFFISDYLDNLKENIEKKIGIGVNSTLFFTVAYIIPMIFLLILIRKVYEYSRSQNYNDK